MKAISPVISSILILVIIISISVVTFYTFSSIIGKTAATGKKTIEKSLEGITPKVEVLDVYGINEEKGLVLFLPFEEGEGNVTRDWSGNGNDGVLLDANSTNADGDTPPKWVEGKYGYALSFDGVDDYVEVNDSTSLRPQSYTVMFWYKSITRPPSYRDILCKGGWTITGFSFLRDYYSEAFYVLVNDQKYGRVYLAHPSIKLDIWYHLALVYDSNNNMMFYLNDEKCSVHNASTMKWDTRAVVMGKDNSIIDEIRIYNRALSEEEVKQIYLGPVKVSLTSKEKAPINGSYFKLKGLSRDYSCSGKLIHNYSYFGPIELEANNITDIYIQPRALNCDLLGSGVYELCLIIKGIETCRQFIVS